MSGTDPKGRWFGKKGEQTSPFVPDGADAGQTLPSGLPKIPGITLQYEIARGGMGVVYSGRQDFLDRRVAVKFLSMELGGETFAKRFQREAKILAGISHPNIVGCHMADTTPEGQSYLVMEFIDGPSLKAWVTDHGAIAPMPALRLIRATAKALAYAHESDIIHRDVKPENILLESATSSALDINFPFLPKVVDLGLARMTHEQVGAGLTSPGSVMGTPATMSPEQFDDPDSVDFRSDIYGLGCCLYEMLVGHPAFRGKKLTDIVIRKREAVAPNPCDENAKLPAAVGAFTQRLLASNREHRPASYKELDREADALMRVLLTRASRTDMTSEMPMDQTVPSALGGPSAPSNPPVPSSIDATVPAAAKTMPADGTKPQSPGMLNTGELDFLSEGGAVGGGGAPPAFNEAGTAGTAPTNPMGGTSSTGGKKAMMIGGGVVLAAIAGVMFGMGDGDADSGDLVGANSSPTVGRLQLLLDGVPAAESRVSLGAKFDLAIEATDADGDELTYAWSWPADAIHPVSQTGLATVQFLLDDGLPGVEHVVSVQVGDGNSISPVTREYRVVVGECPADLPLLGFASTGKWDKGAGTWRQLQDPANIGNRGVAGRVRGASPATLTTTIGSESYWEWTGTLAPTEMGDGDAAASVVLRCGSKGYAVRCNTMVAPANGDTEWTVEVVQQTPGQDEWRSLTPPTRRTWKQKSSSDNTCRGWYSIRRQRERLAIEIGEFTQPAPEPNKPLREPAISPEPAMTVTLSESDSKKLSSEGQLQLRVTKARCVFQATRR